MLFSSRATSPRSSPGVVRPRQPMRYLLPTIPPIARPAAAEHAQHSRVPDQNSLELVVSSRLVEEDEEVASGRLEVSWGEAEEARAEWARNMGASDLGYARRFRFYFLAAEASGDG